MVLTKKWRELEAEGVRRCCAVFTNGKRCRRRAAGPEAAWCEQHGPIMEGHKQQALKAMRCDSAEEADEC
jgi:hypothetical protein